MAAVRTGRVGKLRVGMETIKWTKEGLSRLVHIPKTFYLAPPVERASKSPDTATGTINSITWDESYNLVSPDPADDHTPRPKPTVVELPPTLYWMLGAVIAIGAVIAVLLFLRH